MELPKLNPKDLKIPEHVKQELKLITTLCNQNKGLVDFMYDSFDNAPNAYYYILNILYHGTSGFYSKKNKLPVHIKLVADQFVKWAELYDASSQILNFELKAYALHMVMNSSNSLLIEKVCEIFEMKEDAPKLKEILDRYLPDGNFKQICHIARNCGIFYPLKQVVFPLICTDKTFDVFNYLKQDRELQIKFIKECDEYTRSTFTFQQMINSFKTSYPAIRVSLKIDALRKILSKAIKVFNIPLEHAPYHTDRSDGAHLNYLYRYRFKEGRMSHEAWKEITVLILQCNRNLIQQTLQRLVRANNLKSAYEIAKELNLPFPLWPHGLQSVCSNNGQSKKNPHLEDARVASIPVIPYLTLNNEDSIKFVDSSKTFEDFMLEPFNIIGFDAEWRQAIHCVTEEKLALFQIATWDKVFLLDIKTLLQKLNDKQWQNFVKKVLCNPDVLKIGYSISSDLTMLVNAFKINKVENLIPYLDLATFIPYLIQKYPESEHCIFVKPKNTEKGLSALCDRVLGCPLSKFEQKSDWERRPLRREQILYAALDADCLLQIYEKLFYHFDNKEIDFDELIHDFITRDRKEVKPTEKSLDEAAPSTSKDGATNCAQ